MAVGSLLGIAIAADCSVTVVIITSAACKDLETFIFKK